MSVHWQNWKADDLIKAIDTELEKRLYTAAYFLENEIKKMLSIKGHKCNKDTGERSNPGEPPRLECGQLRSSITHEVIKEELIARVGSNLKKMLYLEVGTKDMAPRPTLRPAQSKNLKTLANILAGKKIDF